nr:MAG TPA: ParB ddrB-like ParB superfamily domain [Herelleviridae sp.]
MKIVFQQSTLNALQKSLFFTHGVAGSVLKTVVKSNGLNRTGKKDEKFRYFQNKIIECLTQLAEEESHGIKKSFFYMIDTIVKSKFPVGTIREWKGKKYIKIAPGKWRPKYDSNSRGAKLAVAALKRKAEQCKTSQELLQLVLENRDRFSDKDGKPLPFVQELRDYVSGLNDKHESTKKEESFFTDNEFKKRLKSGKEIIADFFKEQWNNERYIKAGRDRLMDIWAAGEAKRYESVNTQTNMFKKLPASEKKKAREFNEKLKHEFEAEAARIFEEYKKGGTTKTTRSNSNYTEETLSETPTTSVPQSGKKSSAIMQIRAKYESAPSITGNKKTVTLPNGTKIKCRYKLVEADAPTASHDENTYSPTKGFPTSKDGKTVNDRDYQNDKDAQESVRKIAANFNSLALESPPIVTKDGIVISGNNRTMSSKLAAKNGTDAAYVADLKEMIDEYGLEESDLDGFKHPRLILEIDAEHEGEYTTEEFAQFNRDTKKTMSNVEKAVKITKTLTEEKVQSIASELSNYETMGELYADAKGCQRFVAKLIDAGIIGDNEKAQYLKSDGTLNDTGKDFTETVLVGTILNEDNIRRLDSAGGKRIRQKLVRAILPLVENKGTGKEYSFNKELNEAVDIAVSVAKNHEKYPNVETYLAQGTLFGESKPDEITGKLAKLIHDEGEKAFASRMKNLGAGLKHSAEGEMDIFLGGVETKQSLMERFLTIQKSITDILTTLHSKEQSIRSIVAEALQKQCG